MLAISSESSMAIRKAKKATVTLTWLIQVEEKRRAYREKIMLAVEKVRLAPIASV